MKGLVDYGNCIPLGQVLLIIRVDWDDRETNYNNALHISSQESIMESSNNLPQRAAFLYLLSYLIGHLINVLNGGLLENGWTNIFDWQCN